MCCRVSHGSTANQELPTPFSLKQDTSFLPHSPWQERIAREDGQGAEGAAREVRYTLPTFQSHRGGKARGHHICLNTTDFHTSSHLLNESLRALVFGVGKESSRVIQSTVPYLFTILPPGSKYKPWNPPSRYQRSTKLGMVSKHLYTSTLLTTPRLVPTTYVRHGTGG